MVEVIGGQETGYTTSEFMFAAVALYVHKSSRLSTFYAWHVCLKLIRYAEVPIKPKEPPYVNLKPFPAARVELATTPGLN